MGKSIPLKDFRMTNTEFQSSVVLNKYGNKYSIASAISTDNGIFLEWCFKSKWQKDIGGTPAKKSIPLSIQIGKNKQEAIETLQYLLKQIADDNY